MKRFISENENIQQEIYPNLSFYAKGGCYSFKMLCLPGADCHIMLFIAIIHFSRRASFQDASALPGEERFSRGRTT